MIEELRRSCSRKEEEIEKLDSVNRELRDQLRGLSEEITSKNQSLKSLHGQFVEIDEDIKRFRAEFSEKEWKVRELEEKLRLRESQLEEVRLRLAQREEQEKINMKSVRIKKLPRRERFSLDQSESSLSVLQRPLVRRDRRARQEKEREERGDIEKETQHLMVQLNSTVKDKKVLTAQLRSSVKEKKVKTAQLSSTVKAGRQ